MIYIDKLQIESKISDFDRHFKDILPIPETHKMHCFCTVQKGTVDISRTSKINGTIFKVNDSIFSKKKVMTLNVQNLRKFQLDIG